MVDLAIQIDKVCGTRDLALDKGICCSRNSSILGTRKEPKCRGKKGWEMQFIYYQALANKVPTAQPCCTLSLLLREHCHLQAMLLKGTHQLENPHLPVYSLRLATNQTNSQKLLNKKGVRRWTDQQISASVSSGREQSALCTLHERTPYS